MRDFLLNSMKRVSTHARRKRRLKEKFRITDYDRNGRPRLAT
jgi:hypothetical protein